MIIIGILITIVILGILAFTNLTKEKNPATAAQFTQIMENNGYVVQDATYQMKENVKRIIIALKSDYSYQIEFFEVETEEQAQRAYVQNKTNFEKEASNVKSTIEINGKNFNKYVTTTGENYCVISRIGNTFIYAKVPSNYKEEVSKIIKNMDY